MTNLDRGTTAAPTSLLRRFGRFEVDANARQLRIDGQPLPLGARAFDLLMALVERRDRVVSKHELLDLVWPGLVVEENNLQVQVSSLRKLLGPQAIATIPGRGYRFTLAPDAEVAASAALSAAPAETAPPLSPLSPLPTGVPSTNLPARPHDLFGRADDLRELCGLIVAHPLVAIVGAGGIGKTTLALAVANETRARFPDGAWWVELAALNDPAMVASAVAQALGIGVSAERPAAAALSAVLKPQHALLVLDNSEHVLDAVAQLVTTLLPQCPDVHWLVTSQETLRLPSEQVWRLDGLAVPATDAPAPADAGAVELFVARATAANPRVRFESAQLATVAAICRRLDGVPLAIELAAARVPLLGVEGVHQRLDERLSLLTGGARMVLRRHQTLRAMLEWSHGLLEADEQVVLRRLGVFAGGFALELAQAVAADERIDQWAVLNLLGNLVDKSMVVLDPAEVPRYRLLETTRAFALEQLAAAGETAALLRRHAQALCEYFEPQLTRYWTQSRADVARGVAELDNLRAALDWSEAPSGDRALGCALIGVSGRLWHNSGLLMEGVERCRRLSPLPADLPLRLQARFHMVHGGLGYTGSRQDCFDAAGRAVELYRVLGDKVALADSLVARAMVGAYRGATQEVRAALAEAEALLTPASPSRQRATLALAQNLQHFNEGRHEEALKAAWRQVECHREGGDLIGVQVALTNLAMDHALLGRHDEAIARLHATLAELRRLGSRRGVAWALEALAAAYALRGGPGDLPQALRYARDVWPELQRYRRDRNILSSFAVAFAHHGDAERAALLLGHVDAVWAEEGTQVWPLQAGSRGDALARVRAGLGEERAAELMDIGARLGDERAAALVLEGG